MSEVLRDLVVSLSLDSNNFSRNLTSINRQVAEAESEFKRAAAGVDGFEKSVSGTQAQISSLQQKLVAQRNAVAQYERALEAANTLLAQALAPCLRVCGVAPGVTLPSGPMSDDDFAKAQRLTPLRRSSTGADIARAVRFLLESPAITGTTLLVDGGQHLSAQPRDVMFLTKD